MATMYPPEFVPSGRSGDWAEGLVFDALKNLDETVHVIHTLHYVQGNQGEADFVIVDPMWPRLLILEVKGGSDVRHHRDSRWQMLNTRSRAWNNIKDPAQQAINNGHELLKFLKEKGIEDIDVAYGLVFPGVESENLNGIRETSRVATNLTGKQVLGKPQLAKKDIRDAVEGVFENSPTTRHRKYEKSRTPNDDSAQRIVDFLLPKLDFFQSHSARVEANQLVWNRLSQVQCAAMSYLTTQRMVVFNGVAGSGKTVLAREAARRAKKDGGADRNVLYLCFNRLLAEDVLLHPTRVDSGYHAWTLGGLGRRRENGEAEQEFLYHDIFIDEAQDFNAQDWEDIKALWHGYVNNDTTARLWVLYDEHQQLRLSDTVEDCLVDKAKKEYNFTVISPVKENFRNGRTIGTKAGEYVGLDMQFNEFSPEGECQTVAPADTPREAALTIARLILDRIRDDRAGSKKSLVVIAPAFQFLDSVIEKISNLLCATGVLEDLRKQSRKRDYFRKKTSRSSATEYLKDLLESVNKVSNGDRPVFLSAQGYKGLEASTVVLLVPRNLNLLANEQAKRERYVAATRAQDELLIVPCPLDYKIIAKSFWEIFASLNSSVAEPVHESRDCNPAPGPEGSVLWNEWQVRRGLFVSLGLGHNSVRIFVRGSIDGQHQKEITAYLRQQQELEEALGVRMDNGPQFFIKTCSIDLQDEDGLWCAADWANRQWQRYFSVLSALPEVDGLVVQPDDESSKNHRNKLRADVHRLMWDSDQDRQNTCQKEKPYTDIPNDILEQETNEIFEIRGNLANSDQELTKQKQLLQEAKKLRDNYGRERERQLNEFMEIGEAVCTDLSPEQQERARTWYSDFQGRISGSRYLTEETKSFDQQFLRDIAEKHSNRPLLEWERDVGRAVLYKYIADNIIEGNEEEVPDCEESRVNDLQTGIVSRIVPHQAEKPGRVVIKPDRGMYGFGVRAFFYEGDQGQFQKGTRVQYTLVQKERRVEVSAITTLKDST